MKGLATLAIRHATHHWGRSLVLVACVAIVLSIPLASRVLIARFDASLHARAETTPLIVGAKGSRFDLTFGALYFRATDLDPIKLVHYHELNDEPGVSAIPVHHRYTAQERPVVATTIEYFEFRDLRVGEGRMFAMLGECVLGASAARSLGLAPGDTVNSDQRQSYDITAPPSIGLDVVGVLAPTSSPDDDAIFVDLETAWLLEGIAHGHQDAETVDDPSLLIGRAEGHTALSGALIEHQVVDETNIESFHVHGSRDELPLSAVLVFPNTPKTRTILTARVNTTPDRQAVSPTAVIDDVMAFVVRVRQVFDALSAILATTTAGLMILVGVLSYRIRADEIRTLTDIGCARAAVAWLFALEFGAIIVAGALTSTLLVGLALLLAPRLTSVL